MMIQGNPQEHDCQDMLQYTPKTVLYPRLSGILVVHSVIIHREGTVSIADILLQCT